MSTTMHPTQDGPAPSPEGSPRSPRRRGLIAALAVLGIAVVGWLAFGYFGIQAAFIDSEVSESGPVFASSAPEIVTLAQGSFAGIANYEVSGDALVLNDGSEQRFLRFENFDSSNGPDLKVYLRAANGDFVSLGELKGNIGDQNYEIPTDVDLAVFDTVEIWCERFSVGFGAATLT